MALESNPIDVNVPRKNGVSLLVTAVLHDDSCASLYLLMKGADDSETFEGKTLLELAGDDRVSSILQNFHDNPKALPQAIVANVERLINMHKPHPPQISPAFWQTSTIQFSPIIPKKKKQGMTKEEREMMREIADGLLKGRTKGDGNA
ncbi:MAG: ankyrin repeat domain-containing protein [Candidatus Woesearchaeota archaeon]